MEFIKASENDKCWDCEGNADYMVMGDFGALQLCNDCLNVHPDEKVRDEYKSFIAGITK